MVAFSSRCVIGRESLIFSEEERRVGRNAMPWAIRKGKDSAGTSQRGEEKGGRFKTSKPQGRQKITVGIKKGERKPPRSVSEGTTGKKAYKGRENSFTRRTNSTKRGAPFQERGGALSPRRKRSSKKLQKNLRRVNGPPGEKTPLSKTS